MMEKERGYCIEITCMLPGDSHQDNVTGLCKGSRNIVALLTDGPSAGVHTVF